MKMSLNNNTSVMQKGLSVFVKNLIKNKKEEKKKIDLNNEKK